MAFNFSRGNAIVEFAVAVPFLTVIMLGIGEIGRYAYAAALVANAAKAGAQYGAQSTTKMSDQTGMTNAAKAAGTNIPIPNPSYSPGSVTYYCWNPTTQTETSSATATGCSSGTTMREYVSYQVSGNLTPLFRYAALPSVLHVSSTATMRVCQGC